MLTTSQFRRWLLALFVLALVQWNEPLRAQPFNITAEITVDNNYSFGWGTVNGMIASNFWGPVQNTTAGAIYNCRPATAPPNVPVTGPEFYPNLQPTITDYLYIVAWSDDFMYEGVIGKFTDNNTSKVLYTGDPGWEVFATGIDYDNNSAPTLAVVNAQIALANSNSGPTGSSSVGWVGPSPQNSTNGFLAVGGFNGASSGAPLATVCPSQFPVGSGPRWMWYSDAPGIDVFRNQPSVNNGPGSTVGRGGWREFLIFRMPVRQFQPEVGVLKVCKVAGPGVAAGTLFNFTTGSSTFPVPAGPAPGGICVVGPTFNKGSVVNVKEIIPTGHIVSSITVAPPRGDRPDLATGSVNVEIGSGVTEVTFTDKKPTGFLEICKNSTPEAKLTGSATFNVDPGGLGPFVVPVGACSPAIELLAGSVVITELPTSGAVMTGCTTIPPNRQGPCDSRARTSTVTVVPGDVSTVTIAIVTNAKHVAP